MARTLSLLGLALTLATTPALAGEEIELAWKFSKDQQFTLTYSTNLKMTVETTSSLGTGMQTQEQVYREVFDVRVVKVLPKGGAHLTLRTLDMDMETNSRERSVKAKVRRGDGREPQVSMQAETATSGGGALLKEIMTPVLEAYLDSRIHVVIDSSGKVSSCRLVGDPMRSMGSTGNPTMDAAMSGMKDFLNVEEIIGAAMTQTFIQLPADPVAPGDKWPVERDLMVTGMAAKGRGSATLAEVRGRGDEQIAVIKEEVAYALDCSPYVKNYTAMMKKMMGAMGMDVDIQMEMEAPDGMKIKSEGEFATRLGRVKQIVWGNASLVATGRAHMTLMGEPETMKLTVRASNDRTIRLGPPRAR